MTVPMVFCNVAWMKHYGGLIGQDVLVGGGAGPDREGEAYNFKPLGDHMYGYVAVGKTKTIDVSRIAPVIDEAGCAGGNELGCCDARTEGVDVIWTATRPEGGNVVIGWYRNATVFRHLQSYRRGPYQIKAGAADCRLLPIKRRTLKVERGRVGGSGQTNIWYAEKPYGKDTRKRVRSLIQKAERRIFERQIFDRHDLETKAATLELDGPPEGTKKPWRDNRRVAVVARDPKVHAWILQNAKGRCERCGAAAPFSGPEGRPYLEVHHVARLADGGEDVPGNAVALCPNCHREAHHGAGADAIRQQLRDRILMREN